MNETSLPKRNPSTHQKHRRETFWQITLPLIIGGSLALGLGVFSIISATNGAGGVSKAADTSMIFLLIPMLIAALILLILVAAFAYGMIWLNQNLPPYFFQAQKTFAQIRNLVRIYADKAVEPVLRVQSTLASLKALKRK